MDESAELNTRIVAPIVAYVAEHRGDRAVDELAAAAGVSVEALQGTHWISLEAVERLLACARSMMSSDAEFETACGHRESSIAKRFVIGAIGARKAYELSFLNQRRMSTISRFLAHRERSGAVVLRYECDKPESRLMCLSRRAQFFRMPKTYGMPEAHVHEKNCIVNGDDCCEYVVNVYEQSRWLPVAMGLLMGVLVAFGVGAFELSRSATTIVFGLLGALVGYGYELRRTNRLNAITAGEINQAYSTVAREEADARREMLEMSRRQHEWIRRLEERASEESDAFDHFVRGVDSVREDWVSSIRRFSHDLRTPLTVLKTNLGFLHETPEQLGPDAEGILEDIGIAVTQVESLLAKLTSVATNGNRTIRLLPQPVEIATLATRISKRLCALVYGRGVRCSVLPKREAPATVEVDPLLLDRVLDNLLTNAAKCTERGCIVVELDGRPGFLTLKISDTGCGIDEVEMERVLKPIGARSKGRSSDGWGVGLSVVVELMGRIGGRLEVMSKPGIGTTFWAHFPVQPRSAPDRSLPPESTLRSPAYDGSNVVSIRRLKTA